MKIIINGYLISGLLTLEKLREERGESQAGY